MNLKVEFDKIDLGYETLREVLKYSSKKENLG